MLANNANAAFFSFGFGGITTHYTEIDKDRRYCNELKDTAVIYNQSYYVRFGNQKWSLLALVGQDSICSPIIGAFVSRTLWSGKGWRTGLVVGAYKYDKRHWDTFAQQTIDGDSQDDNVAPEPIDLRIGDRHFVPVLAFEFSVRLFKSRIGSLWLNNIISIFITNHSLNYVVEF